MSTSLIGPLAIFDLEPIEVNLFRSNSPNTCSQRMFGGQRTEHGTVAPCRTIEGRLPYPLHCSVIRAGDPKVPIIWVERLCNTKSYSTRRVTAMRYGNAIFSMVVWAGIDLRSRHVGRLIAQEGAVRERP